ncbi:MAG: hypothetical protein COA99_18235 [Moraxellaceae bacterium]|nr:MAG: hypothetical protein COA99_18235 [Moraxellaceae bacterium]
MISVSTTNIPLSHPNTNVVTPGGEPRLAPEQVQPTVNPDNSVNAAPTVERVEVQPSSDAPAAQQELPTQEPVVVSTEGDPARDRVLSTATTVESAPVAPATAPVETSEPLAAPAAPTTTEPTVLSVDRLRVIPESTAATPTAANEEVIRVATEAPPQNSPVATELESTERQVFGGAIDAPKEQQPG